MVKLSTLFKASPKVSAGKQEVKGSSSSSGGAGIIESFLWALSVFLCCVTCPFSLFYMFRQVKVWSDSSLIIIEHDQSIFRNMSEL